jgi:hypothetical protein
MLADSSAGPLSAPSRCSLLAGCSRPAVAASLLLIVFAQPAPPSCFGADVTLEEIRAGYIQTVTSMPRIWTRCTWKQEIPKDRAELLAKEFSQPVAALGFEGVSVDWAIDGVRSHYYAHGGTKPDGRPRKPDWFSCDGKRVWTLEYSDTEDGYVVLYAKHQSLATYTDSALRMKHTPGKWLGLYFSISEQQQSGASLRTLLHKDDTRLIGPEVIDGQTCYRVEMVYPSAQSGESLPVTAWFDPQVGYLPQMISNDFNGSAPPSDYRVLSFRQIPLGTDGQTMWLPDHMLIERRNSRDTILSKNELTLLEIKINEPLAGDLFRPKLPRGLPVFDLDDPADVQRCIRFQTQPARDKKMAEYQAAKANRVPTAAPAAVVPAIAAEPPSGLSWPLILIGSGLLILLVSTIWTLRWPRST